MALDWMSIAAGAGAILVVQSVSSGFPLLSWLKKKRPGAAPLVDAVEGELTNVAKVVGPSIVTPLQPVQPQTGLAPLLSMLAAASSHINDLQTLQSYLTQLHLTPLPATVTQPVATQPTLADIAARLAKLEAAKVA